MPIEDFWLHKIAAFLHDPPDKGYCFGTRDIDAIRYFTWFVGSHTIPFYLDFSKDYSTPEVKKLAECIQNNWQQFANLLTQQNILGRPRKSELRPICPDISGKVLGELQSILKSEIYSRDFHRIASSQLRLENLGLKSGKELALLLKHPLDENSMWYLENLTDGEFRTAVSDEEKRSIRFEILQFFKSLKKQNDPMKSFLNLWRNPHKLSFVTPTDPSIPDNSLIDIQVIQSAIAATLDCDLRIKASFLILEFGPVQKFIANARKTRDLWFSSWLISYLAWKAMKPIAEELGPDNIVYPDLYKQPLIDDWLKGLEIDISDELKIDMPTLPNTFLAIVPEGEEEYFAQKARERLKRTWLYISAKVRRKVISELQKAEKGHDISILKARFKNQVFQFPFDIYWLGLKWGDDPEKAIKDYKKLFKPDQCWEFGRLWKQIKDKGINTNIGDTYALLVEMAQTGLKALKYRGKPKAVEEPGHKCSLCGERTALTDGDPNDIKGIKKFWRNLVKVFPGHIKENEYLCAVCLVKRLAPKVIYETVKKSEKSPKSLFFESKDVKFDYHFPSTGSVAIAPFIKAMADGKIDFSPLKNVIETLLEQQKDEKSKSKVKNFFDAHFTEGRTVPAIKDRIIPVDIAGEKFEGDFEPEWFYDESFQRFYDELEHQKTCGLITKDEFKQKFEWTKMVEQAVTQIKSLAKNKLGDEYHLSKYYAAVYLDGDNLGKWLRGEFAPKIEDVFHPEFVKHIAGDDHFKNIKDLKRPVTPAIHRAISSALRDFALEVVPYVVEHNLGVVVYSGGDDTLFLMPLENLFKTLIALRKLYSGERFVGEFNERKFESEKGFIKIYENGKLKEVIRVMGTRATLSAGVAIAHYLDPLDITLEKAKEALKEAKNKGRNRVGFKVLLHSGSERSTVVPWNFVEFMDKFKTEVAKGFSPRFLRTLYGETSTLENIPDAFDAEFLKFGARGYGDDAKTLLCSLIDARKDNDLNPKEFIEALLIADFTVREEGSK